MEMTINQASISQLGAYFDQLDPGFLATLWARVNRDAYLRKISTLATNFEAWEDTRLIGLVSVYANRIEEGGAYITHVGIVPDFQGRGIAKKLLVKAIDRVGELGFNRVLLEVDVVNQKAKELYLKLGFVTVSRQQDVLHLQINRELKK